MQYNIKRFGELALDVPFDREGFVQKFEQDMRTYRNIQRFRSREQIEREIQEASRVLLTQAEQEWLTDFLADKEWELTEILSGEVQQWDAASLEILRRMIATRTSAASRIFRLRSLNMQRMGKAPIIDEQMHATFSLKALQEGFNLAVCTLVDIPVHTAFEEAGHEPLKLLSFQEIMNRHQSAMVFL